MFLLISFITIIFLSIRDYLSKQRRNRILKESKISVPPNELPILGNALITIGNNTETMFKLFNHLFLKYGKITRIWAFNQLLILIQDARSFEVILSSTNIIKKGFPYYMLADWLGDGLLLTYGSKWHSRRKVITPSFHFKILEHFIEIFDQQSRVMVKRLNDKADGSTTIEIFHVVCLVALDIIAETAMGVKINAQENPDIPYAKAVTDATDIIGNRMSKPVQHFTITFMISAYPSYRRLKKCIKVMHAFTSKVIRERRVQLENEIKNGAEQGKAFLDGDNVGLKKRMAFLDVLLQSTINGKPLSDADICEEVDTFMFEGHDTTTSAISHCLYELSRNPEVQNKLFEEIRHAIGDNKEKPMTMKDLQDLKYLECVIKESLRLHPPVPIIGRYTEQDVKIDDGITLPAHAHVGLFLYGVGRNPEYFPNVLEFIPERFSVNAAGAIDSKMNPFAYVPFSAGPRNCIGQKFAMLEMKSTISTMIRYYELLPLGPDIVPVMQLILRSATGVNLGLKPRIYA